MFHCLFRGNQLLNKEKSGKRITVQLLVNKYNMKGVPKKPVIFQLWDRNLQVKAVLPKQPWFSSFCVVMGVGPKERIVSS